MKHKLDQPEIIHSQTHTIIWSPNCWLKLYVYNNLQCSSHSVQYKHKKSCQRGLNLFFQPNGFTGCIVKFFGRYIEIVLEFKSTPTILWLVYKSVLHQIVVNLQKYTLQSCNVVMYTYVYMYIHKKTHQLCLWLASRGGSQKVQGSHGTI